MVPLLGPIYSWWLAIIDSFIYTGWICKEQRPSITIGRAGTGGAFLSGGKQILPSKVS